MKKIFKEPLLYLLSLLAISWFLMIPEKVNVSDVKLTYENKTENVKLPLQTDIPQNSDFTISLNLPVAKKKKYEYNVIPDDCIKKIIVNDSEVKLNGIEGLCDCTKGAIIDFTEYLNIGNNRIEFQIYNRGGLGGLRLSKIEKTGFKHFAFTAILLVCVFLLLQKFRFGFRASFVVILGIIVRIILYANTTVEDFNYDFGPHIMYINVIAQWLRIPAYNECFVCYHPPLYYIISAPASYDFNVLRQVQMLFSFLTLSFGVALIYRMLGKNMTAFLTSLLWVLWPGFVLSSARIGNDIPFYFGTLFCIYFVYNWWHKQKKSYFILATLGAILSVAFKSTGFVILGVWAIIYICGAFKNLKIGSLKVLIASLVVVLLSLGVSQYKFIGDIIKYKKVSFVRNVGGLPDGLRVRNDPGNYIYFDVKDFLTEPYANPWDDKGGRQYFWNYSLKTSLFGEFKTWNTPIGRVFASLISLFALVLVILSLWGMLHSNIKEFPLLLFLLALFAALMYARIQYPYSCTNDFRYIMPAILPISYFSIKGVQVLAFKRLQILGYASIMLFAALSFAFIVGQAF